MKRILITILLCTLTLICYGQINNDYPFGHYTIVTGQDYPTYKGNLYISHTTYDAYNYQQQYYTTTGQLKAPGDKWSGSSVGTVDGVSVTVNWTVSAPGMGLIWWTITYTYPDGHTETEEYYGSPGNARNHAQAEAEEKARELAEEQAHAFPISSVTPLFLMIFVYFILKFKKSFVY